MALPDFDGKLNWLLRRYDIPSAAELRWYMEQLEGVILATKDQVLAQIADAKSATDNVAGDVSRIKAKLDGIISDNQGAIDGAVSAALQDVSDGLAPLVTQLQGVAAETPEDVVVVDENPAPVNAEQA